MSDDSCLNILYFQDVRPECFSYVNNVWTQIESLTVPRTDSAFTTTPELSSSSKNDIMAIGGDNFAAGFLASSEIYTVSGNCWRIFCGIEAASFH